MGGILDFLRRKKSKTSTVARDRLQVIVAHERQTSDQPSWMPKMQQEIMAVIAKYISIDNEALKVEMSNEDDMSVLEISVDCPLEDKDN
jgi:cell division topological specificity factor